MSYGSGSRGGAAFGGSAFGLTASAAAHLAATGNLSIQGFHVGVGVIHLSATGAVLAHRPSAPTPLYEDFDHPSGTFINVDTYDPAQRLAIFTQRHVDIRSFEQNSSFTPYTMFELDAFPIGALDGLTMTQLESDAVVIQGEAWSAGTVGPQSDRRNFNGLSLSCSTGTTTTTSIAHTVDISAFANTDYISLALPAFPLVSINLAASFLDITSEPTGNFAVGPTDSLAFSSAMSSFSAGDTEARFPLSALSQVDRSRITGVRFRITATAPCSFRCLAIRCLAASWQYAPVDQNTLYDRLGATVPPSGSLSQSFTFPQAGGGITPQDWPVLFFSDGEVGPRCVDIDVGTVIQTGTNSVESTFTLYFRELSMIPETMTSLDGMSIEQIEAIGSMPDFTPGVFDNFATSKFLTVTMNWGTSGSLHLKDDTGTGYDFTGLTFAPSSLYYLLVKLVNNSLRASVYPISDTGMIAWQTPVFDTTALVDGNFVRRRRGRFGWYANLGEGNTYVKTLRPQRVVYAEYQSAPLLSETPVEGARLFVSATPDIELYDGATATPGVTLALDNSKSSSGKCLRVTCDGKYPLEGLISSLIRYENFYATELEFDILTSVTLAAALVGENRILPLHLPSVPANRWTHIRAPMESLGPLYMPGPYLLYIVQTETNADTWFIDNLSIHTKAVSWSGRGQAADPWRMNDPAWINFGDMINNPVNGALLGRGRSLQIRGQTLTQDAGIDSLQILPQYATLGNLVWSEQVPTYDSAPVPSFTTTASLTIPSQITFDGSASTATDGIASWYWEFGDGAYGYGETIIHTYQANGTYTITLVVTDTLGQQTSLTHNVTI